MNNTLNHKCPKCNAVLKFNPEGQNFKCEYCRSIFNLNDLSTVNLSEETNNIEIDIYTCQNCGAEILTDKNTSINSCIYCKSAAILKTKLEDDFNPGYIIPFKITKDEAMKSLKKLKKDSGLIPKKFNIKKHINDIRGIYAPFTIYNCDSSGEVNFECDKLTTWKSNGYKYTKTDKFSVTRGGSISFENVLVNGGKEFENDIMDFIEPYDYKEIIKFDYSYLSGYITEKYSLTKTKLKEDASSKVKKIFIDEMKKNIKGYDKVTETDNSINIYNFKSSYVLLPVWFLNIKYKNEIYTFAINGQTGKASGKIPVDIRKIIILLISIFIIVFALLVLLNFLKVML